MGSEMCIRDRVIDEDALVGFQLVFVQQRLIDAGVGFVDLHLAGGYAAVEETLEVPLHQQGKHILGNVAQVVDAVAMLLELLDKGLHPAAGAEDMHPVVQNALYLKGAACLFGPVEHLSLIHISEPTRRTPISYAVFCLKKKLLEKKKN